MTAQQLFSTYSAEQIRAGFIRYVSNQRKNDKYSIVYFLHMINHNKYWIHYQYPEDSKRAELLAMLLEEIQQEKALRICIQSDYTTDKVLWEIEEIEIDAGRVQSPANQ